MRDLVPVGTLPANQPRPHRWRFYRAGGVDQVRIDTGADIFALEQLDQKLWVALSCPVKGLEFDDKTLALIDADGDGFVRPPEILGAVTWLRQLLKDPDVLLPGTDGVQLDSLRTDTSEGKQLLASARHVLSSLGRADAKAITIADTLRTAEVFANARQNGDGVVPPAFVDDAAAAQVAQEIIDCVGSELDRSGKPGITRALLDAFFKAAADYDVWYRSGEADPARTMPLGGRTAAAAAALCAIEVKADDFFARCAVAAFDGRALPAMNHQAADWLVLADQDVAASAAKVAQFPLAEVAPHASLPLQGDVNPAWAARLDAFRSQCCPEQQSLTEAEWRAQVARFDGYRRWCAAKAGAQVERLGIARVRQILAGRTHPALLAAIDADAAIAAEIAAIIQVEKLCRLHLDLRRLLENYVSFTDFYARRSAIFQAGRLHFDGRTTELVFKVTDPAKHATLAPMAKTYLAYLDCTRHGCDKITLAAAFTAGDSDNLFVGRNGLFYDRRGRDWNATITRIVDNPISIGQALWSPYKKALRWVEEQVAKRAAAADADAATRLQTAALAAGTPGTNQPPGTPKKLDIGVLAAISVAIGGVTTAIGGIMQAFFGLGYLMPLGVLGLIVLISGPAVVIAWLKLRQRNLGPILDANGWAVNVLTKINIPLGRSLTVLPQLPRGSERSLSDPYAPAKSWWPKILLVLLVLGAIGYGLYHFDYLHRWWPAIPAYHHDRLDPQTRKGVPGAVIEIEVHSATPRLTWAFEGSAEQKDLPVADHKATLTIPADAKPHSHIVVKDPTVLDNQFTIRVVEPEPEPAKK